MWSATLTMNSRPISAIHGIEIHDSFVASDGDHMRAVVVIGIAIHMRNIKADAAQSQRRGRCVERTKRHHT
jgi:hypothetical protein